MDVEQLWRRYSATWFLPPEERSIELPACVTEDVSYLDPMAPAEGIDGLSEYMEGFRHAVPGARFEIIDVRHHHDRSLARWQLRAADGNVAQTGTSAANHATDGRLAQITGFFDEVPARS